MHKLTLLIGALTTGLCQTSLAAPKAARSVPKAEPAAVAPQAKETLSASKAPAPSEAQAQKKLTLLSFELSGNLGFGAGGYSLGPDLGYTPQFALLPLVTLAPRLDITLFKSPDGLAPLFRFGVEGWFNVHRSVYLAPGLGLGVASAGVTKAFAMASATAGYRIGLWREHKVLSKLDRLVLRYDLWVTTQIVHQVSLGLGINI